MKLYNEQGFLSKEGKAFINDTFVKEMKRAMATATSAEDVLVISGILKSLVGDHATNLCLDLKNQEQKRIQDKTETKSDSRLIQPEKHKLNKVSQFTSAEPIRIK